LATSQERAFVGTRDDGDGGALLGCGERRVYRPSQRMEQREIGGCGKQAAREDDRLAADVVRQPAEEDEEWGADGKRYGDHDVRRRAVEPHRFFEEEEGVELPGVPDDRLPGDRPEQLDEDHPQVRPAGKGFAKWGFRRRAGRLHLLVNRALVELETDPQRDAEQEDGGEEGQPPAIVDEGRFADRGPQADDDQKGGEQPQSRRRLDPAGVEAAAVVRRMLGDIGGRAAILPAQGEALQHAQGDQQHGRCQAGALICRQQADREGREAHDAHGDEEGVLAPDEIADAPEHKRPERADREARSKGGQRQNEGGCFVDAREELRRQDRCKQSVKVEVVPFENGAERRRGND
jgi:hypothetical protein